MPTQNTVVTRLALEYFEALVANGLFVIDANGAGSINPPVADVLNAMHEILAGGRVTVTITSPGNQGIKSSLDARQRSALASLNSPAPSGGGTIFTP